MKFLMKNILVLNQKTLLITFKEIEKSTGEDLAYLVSNLKNLDELNENILKENKIENILSLRGDYPKDYDPKNTYHYFKYASELNEFITKNYPDTFCLSGACYPEVHQEATSLENDLDALKKKVDAGAQYLITQIFFDNNYYYRLLREARIKGQCPYYCWDNASN